MYVLGKSLQKEFLVEEVLAQKLVPDSYVSLEFVLSQVSWIPEAVYIVICVSNEKYNTSVGCYEYIYLPQKKPLAGVVKYTDNGNQYQKAKPLKALADIIYERKYNWTTLYPLYESFRIEDESLEMLRSEDFEELQDSYGVKNVENFLDGIRKELRL